ncbi:MAG: ABC-2 family transporter protein [Candidatus Levybacteria bacterium]|nr:ABC-2 family transporter protein [Candidatus Levybacteria bacterium]
MTHYLTIYLISLRLNFLRLLEYRANFVNSTISSVGWGVFSVIVIFLLTAKVPHFFGWTRNELLVLSACVNIFFGFFRGMFSGNFETISVVVKFGKLDGYLTKPVNSQFLISTTYMTLTGLFRVVLGALFLWYLLYIFNMPVNIFDVLLFMLLLGLGIILLYSLWFIVITLTIWYPNLSNIVGLMYAFDSTIRYPQEMYKQLQGVFFFIFPFTLVIIPATKALLHKVTIIEVLSLLLFSLVFLYLSNLFWRYALRFYTSASS